jgi:hypothetical protein
MIACRLTKTHYLAVLNRTSPVLPTHLLAVHDAPLSDPNVPLTLIPINIDTFSRKLRTNITSVRHNLLMQRISVSSSSVSVVSSMPLPAMVTVPVVPLQVPHAPSISLLLLCALGVSRNPSALAATLLPLFIAEEFPLAAAMAQAMATHCERENTGLIAQRFKDIQRKAADFADDAPSDGTTQLLFGDEKEGPKVDKGKAKAVERLVSISDSPPLLSPQLSPQPLIIKTSSPLPPKPILLVGLSFPSPVSSHVHPPS